MTKCENDEWRVLPHSPLEQLADNIWRVQGSLRGMSLKRNMVVVRLNDGTLLLHSAIALDETRMRELESLGTPSYMVVPNPGHRLDAPAYKKRYPALKVFAPQGARERVESMVHVDGNFDEFPKHEDVMLEKLPGVADAEGVMRVLSSDGVTLVFTDSVFNMDRKRDLLGFLFTTILGSAPGPRVPRLAKLVYIKDQKALKGKLEELADTPNLQRVIVAHEKVASGKDAAAALRQAATYL